MIAESFERIHRTNLVGMGVLPLEFGAGATRRTLALDGSETYSIDCEAATVAARSDAIVRVERRDGTAFEIPVRVRLDTEEEVQVFRAGGLLPRIRDEFLAGRQDAGTPNMETVS